VRRRVGASVRRRVGVLVPRYLVLGVAIALLLVMAKSIGPVIGLFTTAAVATAGYLLVSSAVARGKTRDDDRRARRKIVRRSSKPLRIFSEATGHIGKWYVHMPVAALGASALARTGHRQAAATLASTSVIAAAASRLLDRIHDHRTPPPGKHDPSAQSYPSGHAIETTSVAFVAAWILASERISPAFVVAPATVVISLISGLGRLVLDRHWVSDAAAGYCAGIALGAACAGTFELSRPVPALALSLDF
jgi:undecaprenyl-diphosphatase